jgi:hypothetical protein
MLDTYITHNPNAPWNQKESDPLTELEEHQLWNSELLQKLKKAKSDLQYCIELSELGNNVLLTNKLKAIRL